MTRWQDDVSLDEWDEWQSIARRAAYGRNRSAVNSAQDLASLVIEKLLKEDSRPPNIEAWIKKVTKTTFIDLWRTRTKFSKVDIDDFDAETDEKFARQVTETLMGPKTAYMLQESIQEILGFLSEKHQRLTLMSAAGFSAQEIAEELGYASPQAVNNQLRRIREDVQARFEGPIN
jgi:RNA polymerase sigma factor (sigma-70 family)